MDPMESLCQVQLFLDDVMKRMALSNESMEVQRVYGEGIGAVALASRIKIVNDAERTRMLTRLEHMLMAHSDYPTN